MKIRYIPNRKIVASIFCLLLFPLFTFFLMSSCDDDEEEKSYAVAVPQVEPLKNMKLISYNVYYGLRKDQTLNKQHFIDWINKHDPDIVAIQEANGFNNSSLATLASSYGHSYSALLRESGFPVAITSKHPITNIKRVFTSSNQGYIHANILDYNFIVLHLNAASEENRQAEMQTLLSNTLDTYPFRKKWLIMGDFNCVSPLDKEDIKGSSGVKDCK
ncbi:MAG: endonuclease/exonuclease/phosphatase family protein [Dysgonomonas sp.]|nr:endonuclease/exonuclease/phosphatase family protein [Dysgonomonas sp.]